MRYTLRQLVDIPKLQELTDRLYEATGIPSAIITIDGEILTGSGWQRICTDFHRKHPDIEKECIASDVAIRKQLDGGEPFAIYTCPRGLTDASIPIIVDGEHLANAFAGQLFLEPPDQAVELQFREHAREFGLDEEKYISAFHEIPVFPIERFRIALLFLASLAELIAELGLQRCRGLEVRNRLQESDERYRTLFEAGDCVFLLELDASGTPVIVDLNKAAAEAHGYSCEELLGQPITFLDDFATPAANTKRVDEIKEKGQAFFETKHRRKDGSTFVVEVKAVPVRIGSKQLVMTVERDITDRVLAEARRREVEEKLLQGQKLEALGTLAGGVAHEFNNILMAIKGYSELVSYALPDSTPERKYLQRVLDASDRGAGVVSRILSFSRQSTLTLKPIQVGPVVEDACRLLKDTLPTTIAVQVQVARDAGTVLADEHQLMQMIVNLASNGAYAMGEHGGTLGITLKRMAVDAERAVTVGALRPGDYVDFCVSDDGRGMEAETVGLMFDPFFTTKPPGEGTGLGLSVVHGTVSTHSGAIEVETVLGEGTAIHIYLPIVETVEAQTKPFEPAATHPSGARILFVDDEEPVATLAELMLKPMGCRVTVHTECAAALAALRSDPDAFDLLITDYSMPALTGSRLAQLCRELNPRLPVILVSGYADAMSEVEMADTGIATFLAKPYSAKDLIAAIETALRRR